MTTVLLVDDDPTFRTLVRVALTGSAFTVVGEAADGDEALAAVPRLDPDLVLLDLAMPGADGFAALDGLERLAAAGGPRPQVVVVSGLPAGNLRRAPVTGRVVGYLAKGGAPSRLAEELDVLVRMLDTVGAVLEERSTTLAADPRSARAARQFVDEALQDWDRADLFDTVALLVSELVGNAVRHAGTTCEVSVRLLPDAVRVDVRDDSPELPQRRVATDEDDSGRGLAMTEALARSWGVDVLPTGKSIWFELPLSVERTPS